jgi:hypothetical protein
MIAAWFRRGSPRCISLQILNGNKRTQKDVSEHSIWRTRDNAEAIGQPAERRDCDGCDARVNLEWTGFFRWGLGEGCGCPQFEDEPQGPSCTSRALQVVIHRGGRRGGLSACRWCPGSRLRWDALRVSDDRP